MNQRNPIVETRRAREFLDELTRRARAWIPAWELDEDSPDFGRALLQVAARFDAEVAERLARIPEKNARGFLSWLGLQGKAARAARVPVVFRLGARTAEPVLARAPVKLQAAVDDHAIVFETETDIQLAPGQLRAIVAVDAATDAFYLPAPGLADIEPEDGLPGQWRIKSFAAAGATRLQLDPALGLAAGMLVEAGDAQYRILAVNNDIVTIEPALKAVSGLVAGTVVNKVAAFVPFGATARNRQQHVLYLGHTELLDLEAAATIEVSGVAAIPDDVAWEYWGKREGDDEDAPGWQALTPVPAQAGGSVVLRKQKGSIDMRQVGTVESRWIRARVATVYAPTPPVDAIALLVNPGEDATICPFPAHDARLAPRLEGIANTMPLVLDQAFYPFGQEPRQFDAFYLGCAEAFSKKGAKVSMCFELANPNLGPLAVLRHSGLANQVMAAVGGDGFLYLLRLDQADGQVIAYDKRKRLQPPGPGFGGASAAQARVSLDRALQWRPGVWAGDDGFLVAVAARSHVWVWHELSGHPKQSGWKACGAVGPGEEEESIAGLVFVGAEPRLVALHGARLFETEVESGDWRPLFDTDPSKVGWSMLVDFVSAGADAQELLAIDNGGNAHRIWHDGTAWSSTKIGTAPFSRKIRPVAWRTAAGSIVVVGANVNGSALLVVESANPDGFLERPLELVATGKLRVFGTALDTFVGPDGERQLVLLAQPALADSLEPKMPAQGDFRLLAWSAPGNDGILYELAVPPGLRSFRAAGPAVAGNWLAIPGANSDLMVGNGGPAHVLAMQIGPDADLTDALFDVDHTLAVGDLVWRSRPEELALLTRVDASVTDQNKKPFYLLELHLGAQGGELSLYRRSQSGSSATIQDRDRTVLALDAAEERLACGQLLLIAIDGEERLYEIASFSKRTRRKVKLNASLHGEADKVLYWMPEAMKARVNPLVKLTLPPGGYWSKEMLTTAWFSFPGTSQARQQASSYVLSDGQPALLAFDGPWPSRPSSLLAENASAKWHRRLADTQSNPELSWEYWNGTGWWTIDGVKDGTARLRKNGMLSLVVPPDLQATDWAGKTNFWIRARLVGGDYGRESVTVKQVAEKEEEEEKETSTTRQTIERDTDDIHAPLVVQLQLRYSVEPTRPTWLLTQDSGAIRDQSDANRTDGATIDLFVPLGVALAGLDTQAAPLAPLQAASAHCGCTPDAAEPAPAAGRALYLGFDARLHGGPLRLLFKAGTERDHDAFAPLRIEAIDAGRIAPLVAADDTRALGETGLLTFALPAPPQATDLFGEALYWVRLRPVLAPGAGDREWQPDIDGIYLNAVWAQAAETQEFEMLGSSDGAPNQIVFLARPPVLDNTLVLRVREPLGDEERAQLLLSGADTVLSAVPGQPGDWVLWKQVGDPADSGPGERVYALDAASGEIRFGDGLHGAIVPIGRDAVMAFRYRRTERDTGYAAPTGTGEGSVATVPANGLTDGASLSIVTPVESVEAVFAAGQAAGGADAEDAARVLRFGPARMRHRERVLTAADLEQMALHIAPEVAQARCLRGAAGIRLVLVMRGSQPAASRAQKRELRNALLAAAAPLLARKGALELVDPVLRPVSVRLVLATASLDYSGQLADAATAAVRAMFDPATGAVDGAGWRLGEAPAEADIAACLLDLPLLDSIVEADLFVTGADGSMGPAPASLRPHELAVLGAIDLHIVTTETLP